MLWDCLEVACFNRGEPRDVGVTDGLELVGGWMSGEVRQGVVTLLLVGAAAWLFCFFFLFGACVCDTMRLDDGSGMGRALVSFFVLVFVLPRSGVGGRRVGGPSFFLTSLLMSKKSWADLGSRVGSDGRWRVGITGV